MSSKMPNDTSVTPSGLDFDLEMEFGNMRRSIERVREPQPLRRPFNAALSTGAAPANPVLIAVQGSRPATGRIWEIIDIGVYASDSNSANGHTAPTSSVGVNVVVLAATTVASFNNNPFPVQVTVTGGTVSAILVNGNTTGLTSGTVTVPAFGTLTVNYTAPPTLTTVASAQIVADMYAGPTAGMDNAGDMASFIVSSTIPTTTPLIGDKKAYAGPNDIIYAWIYNAGPNATFSLAGEVLDWRIEDRTEMTI